MTADIAALWDRGVYNPGFIVVKPTSMSKQVYKMMKLMTSSHKVTNHQVALNKAIIYLKQNNRGLKVNILNQRRFFGGLDYFDRQRHWFASEDGRKCHHADQRDCAVMVHGSWIISKAAKLYRFREMLMWMYDGTDQYYTSNTRLYLTYTNPVQRERQQEIFTLKTAMTIGYILNRTVIFPRFHTASQTDECPLYCILHVYTFDKYFAGHYRESTFLYHPKVPHDVKSGLSEQLTVVHTKNTSAPHGDDTVSHVDIVRQFGDLKDRVLVFVDLHNVHVDLGEDTNDSVLRNKLQRAFVGSKYKPDKRWAFQ